MGAVVSCVSFPTHTNFFLVTTANTSQFESILRTIGNCLMAIVNGIGSVLQAIIGAIVGLFDIVISCLTCGRSGRTRNRIRTRHTTSRI
jgi:hypothetical protein